MFSKVFQYWLAVKFNKLFAANLRRERKQSVIFTIFSCKKYIQKARKSLVSLVDYWA